MTTPSSISSRIISFYRGWHDWVEKAHGYEMAKFVVIDDLAPPTSPAQFDHLDDIKTELAALQAATESWGNSKDRHLRYSYSKLRQSWAYLNQTSGAPAEREEIERRGTRWLEITEERLSSQVERIRAHRRELENGGFSPRKLTDYHDTRLDNVEVPELIAHYAKAWLPILYTHRPHLIPFEFDVEAVSSPGTWRNMVVHNGRKFVLRVNVARQVYYTRGVAESLAMHEVCGHMAHLQQLSRNRHILEYAPHLLCITIHGQDSGFAEGVAQFIPLYLAGHVRKEASPIIGELLNFELNFAVKLKNIVNLIRGEVDIGGAAAIHRKYLPWDGDASSFYARVIKDPFFACQILNYTSSLDDFKPVLEGGSGESLDETFDRMMTGFYAHADVSALMTSLR